MTYKTLVKRIALREADYEEIRQAVRAAESRTSGEIMLAITAESSSYAYHELLAALVTALLLLACLLPLSAPVSEWMEGVFWGTARPWYLTAFFLAVTALTVGALYLLYNIPWLDRLVIPPGARRKAVTDRALRCFVESGAYCTSGHSGILIFVSYFEREVRIIADRGISQRISQDLWNLIADELTEGFAGKNVRDAFLGAVKRCGDLLAELFPAEGSTPNELSDGLIVLANERWA